MMNVLGIKLISDGDIEFEIGATWFDFQRDDQKT